MMVTACGEADRTKAEAGASWLTQHRLFRLFGKLGEISKVVVDSAKMIRMEVDIRSEEHADAIDAQSLLLQSMIARFACPDKGAKFWSLVGKNVGLRVNLKSGEESIASGICRRQ
jgi:hypothetical protein